VTVPRRVGRPLSPEGATAELVQYFSDPRILKVHPSDEIGEVVLRLLRKHDFTRQDVFDAAIAVAMVANGIRKICTYDTAHFSRFSEIEVLRTLST
jgi:predicted nucleic acid-binding protein